MDTATNNASQSPIAILRIRHSNNFTEELAFNNADDFLRVLADTLDTHGIIGVAEVCVCDQNDLALRYRVHELIVGEHGVSAIPERYWRLSLKDYTLMVKLERLMAFEEAEHIESRITQFIPDCELGAVIVEPLANRLSDETLLELVDAFYEALPASYRIIVC